MKIEFEADSVSVESIGRYGRILITADANHRDVAAAMETDDRLYEIDPEEIVNQVGANELLDAMDIGDISFWISSRNIDPTDFLGADDKEAVEAWLKTWSN